jgi:hypothetical protein
MPDTATATAHCQSGWWTPLSFPTLLKYTVRKIDNHMANWKVIALINGDIWRGIRWSSLPQHISGGIISELVLGIHSNRGAQGGCHEQARRASL